MKRVILSLTEQKYARSLTALATKVAVALGREECRHSALSIRHSTHD